MCLVPRVTTKLGTAAYLGAITTVFAHPGRRFGQLVEALVLAVAGTVLGLAWSLLGLYLSSFLITSDPAAAYSIRGIFLTCALLLHGYLRSKTPRLFVFVLLLVIVSVVTATSTASVVTRASATQILYPILLAVGVILVVNLFLFPEFSASFLGETTISTLHETTDSLQKAARYFIELAGPEDTAAHSPAEEMRETEQKDCGRIRQSKQKSSVVQLVKGLMLRKKRKPASAVNPQEQPTVSLKDLMSAKAKLRSKLSSCRAAQSECNFEIAFAVLPPRSLKPISTHSMKRLVANTIAVIGACESKFALLGEKNEPDHSIDDGSEQVPPCSASVHYTVKTLNDRDSSSPSLSGKATPKQEVIGESPVAGSEKPQLDLVKRRREIEFGDVRLLRSLLYQIATPYQRLNVVVSRAIASVTECIAYTYDVAKLPSGARRPTRLSIEDLDLRMTELSKALVAFDVDIAAALEGAVENGPAGEQMDIMPREEIFLVASFVLNIRQATSHVEEMLRISRSLVLQRQSRHQWRRFYAPRIKWSKWLSSGGDEDEALPSSGRQRNRKGEEDEKADDEPGAHPLDSEENLIESVARKRDLESGQSTDTHASIFGKTLSRPTPKTVTASKLPKNDVRHSLLRQRLADCLEWVQGSDDLLYAFKLSIAVLLVTWPAFVARWNRWFSLNRGRE